MMLISDNILRAYKSAYDYIIELEIDMIKSKNNLSRNVFDIYHAKFRCDKAYVVRICNKYTGEEIDSITSKFDSKFIYKEGNYIQALDYNENVNAICTTGIHFYCSKEAAYYHDFEVHDHFTGVYKNWDDDGKLLNKTYYINGTRIDGRRLYTIENIHFFACACIIGFISLSLLKK